MPWPAAGLLFFELLFLSFRSLFLALFTFPEEFKMLLKERASGMYQLSAFFFARTLSGDHPEPSTTILVIVTWVFAVIMQGWCRLWGQGSFSGAPTSASWGV